MIASTSGISHHMTLSVCDPGYTGYADGSVWDCTVDRHRHLHGGDNDAMSNNGLPKAPTCSGPVFTWLPGNEDIALLEGVGIKLNRHAGARGIGPIVLEVHYANLYKYNGPPVTNGREGKILQFVPSEMVKYESGLMLLEPTSGTLPANSVTHVEVACRMPAGTMIHIYATGTHTHKLGTRVSGWRISPGGIWTLIAASNTPMSQSFPSRDPLPVQSGDVIAGRCTYNNTKDHDVFIG